MSFLRLIESWAEGLLRIVIGAGLGWIGAVEGGGYGLFLEVVGTVFIAAGIAEIWSVDVAVHTLPRRWRAHPGQRDHECAGLQRWSDPRRVSR